MEVPPIPDNVLNPDDDDASSSSSSSQSSSAADDVDTTHTSTHTSTHSSSLLNNNNNVETTNQRGKAFIEREEKHVRNVRRALAIAILICAIIVTSSVYVLSRRSEYKSFEHEFMIFTSNIITNVQWESNYNFALLEQLSSHITSIALASNVTFPNITVPHFEVEAGYVNGLGGMIACVYAPFILENQREQWEEYAFTKKGWVDEAIELREIHTAHLTPLKGTKDDEHSHETDFQGMHADGQHADELLGKRNYSNSIYHWVNGSIHGLDKSPSTLYAPLWQVTPPVPMAINSDLLSSDVFMELYSKMMASNKTVISSPSAVGQIFDFLFHNEHVFSKLEPYSFIAAPVYDSFFNDKIVGMTVGLTPFDNLLNFLFPDETKGIIAVVTDNCGKKISYEINGPEATFLGYDDLHDPLYDSYMQAASVELNETSIHETCALNIHLYPSSTLRNSYTTNKPFVYAAIVFLSFVLTSILILFYDQTVTKRQEKTMRSALQNGALVASLFPEIVRERLFEDSRLTSEAQIRDKEGTTNGSAFRTRPIADFFPNTTLMFADISGFTAWSSTREPFQVFELLETIYGAFDELAKRRGIFKVETVGDCYVAVSGIPEAREDHAVAMAKFARDCLYKMRSITKILEVSLGPDTSALAFRVGLHSGPVTGGVLRGDNARFQLFGDTVNTAARMESTGLPHRIQISQATADLLIAASKEHWIKPRDEIVIAKGKGEMKTFWLTVEDDRNSSRHSQSVRSQDSEKDDNTEGTSNDQKVVVLSEKTGRLVNWNVQMLLRCLKLIIARRGLPDDSDPSGDWDWDDVHQPILAVVDEVAEIITLPKFSSFSEKDSESVNVSDEIENQLHDYVESIAKLYRNNSFHNFEHASHVTMSVVKLMGRIVPTSNTNITGKSGHGINDLALHDHTYGITSDPLTQFACIFAALIHDVDHHGVSNTQLVREQATVALLYAGKSVLEQNSVVLAWNLLMEPRFKTLRISLCATDTEAKRFRQLVVNAVMATDIMASDLKAIRNCRWKKAFSSVPLVEDQSDTVNRKATIVIDHMIQASDVCHTMQHWHIYRKWNELLFIEMTKAYNEGRAEKNPADTWYQGEIGFFDYYVIPLAKKLAECGVFGVSSDEYLTYAVKNRDEWEARGEQVVREMIEHIDSKS